MSKQEFILSFDNQQKKRYEEFLFEYRNYSIIDKYQFIYQRDGISLDVEYFKDLVFLSKKATRSSLLCSYLPIEHQENIELQNDLIRIKMQKPIRLYAIINLTKYLPLLNIFATSFMAYPTFKHYTARFENLSLERYYDDFLSKLENLSLDRVSDDNMTILKSYFTHKDFILNIYQNFNLTDNDEFALNIYEHVPLVHYRIKPYLNIFEDIFTHRDNFLFVEDEMFLEQDDKNMYLQNALSMQLQDKDVILYENIFAKNPHSIIINIFNEIITGQENDRALYRFENIFGQSEEITARYYSNDFVEENFNRTLNTFENNMGVRQGYILNHFENNNAYKVYTGQLAVNKIDPFRIPIKTLYINNISAFNKNALTYLNYFNTYAAFSINGKGLIANQIEAFNKDNKALYADQYSSFVQNSNKTLNVQDLYEAVNKNVHTSLSVYDIIPFTKGIKQLYLNNTDSFSTSSAKFLFDTVNIEFAMKYNANIYMSEIESFTLSYKDLSLHTGFNFFKDVYRFMFIDENNMFANMNKKHIYTLFKQDFADKGYHWIKIYNGINSVQKSKKAFQIILNTNFFEKKSNKMYLNQNKDFYTKISKGIYITNTHTSINKQSKLTNHKLTMFGLDKINHFLQGTFDLIFSNKYYKNLFLDNTAGFLYKEYKETSLNTDYVSDIFKEYFNVDNQQSVISINKVNKPMFTSEIIDRIMKHAKETEIFNTDSLLNKLIKSTFIQENLICDKLMHNADFISLLNTMVIKKRIQMSFFNNDIFIDKLPSGTLVNETLFINKMCHQILQASNISVYRNTKQICYENNLFLNKYLQAFMSSDIYVTRDSSALDAFSQEWITTMRYAFMHQDITTFRNLQETYADDTGIWTFKQNLVDEFDQEFATIDKHMKMYEALSVVRTNNFPAAFYDQYFLSKDIIVNTLPSLDEIHKIAKDLDVLTNDEIDWAWVYQEDEGFDDPFKIDELLLPENDSRYEDFEDILFNRKTLKPRNPVQIIDDYTFIAKYPNHYPIKDENGENAYKNVALEYLDVRTSIMRKVFIGYYKLWQDHIFEFSRMTIPQSAKTILDYLYVWILMSFAEEDIPEALRVFRQVRWYLERGIIECSEYYITYEPDDLTSGKLDNTNLEIPSDLLPPDDSIPQNNTMYIDTNRHIITNNPNKLGQEAHITFYIDNNRDTTISFSLHTWTPVYIILNEGLPNETILDTITLPTTGKMVYNIPYTGDTNTFTIKKLGADNHDNEFFIGNIIITGMGSNGNLNIEFNPKIQGNKVLNHVSQKVIAYMNLYNDNEEIMRQLVRGNVHLSEVYETLLTYWDLHWQDKDKGKRLTIKRT